MKKRREIFIVVGFLLLISFFALILYYSDSYSITGFVIFNSQPNVTNGKDTYIRELSSTNYGDSTTLNIGTASTGGGRDFKALLYFNLSSIPPENTIVSANLSIYISSSSNENNITLNVYRITSNWTEDEATWYAMNSSTNWTSEGGDYNTQIFNSSIITNQTGWVNFSISLLARNWVNGTYENLGLILYAPDAVPGDYKSFYSSNYTDDASLVPKLIIEYVTNAAPSINSITSNSSQASPTPIGDKILFTLNWTDLESDNAKIYICNSSNITFAGGCEDTTFCSTSLASTNPATCTYTTLTTDNRTTSFWAAACDSINCSSVSAENYFYVNHNPLISLTQPNGGETVNQSQGNYSIQFSVSDADSDDLTATLYYGETSGSTTNTIANINLSGYCIDADGDTATTNTCNYSWNSIGIYGTYYMTIVINDSYTTTNDTSDATFDVRSIVDIEAPQITSTSIDSTIFSGKTTTINATITDDNIITAIVDLNYTSTNLSMTNSSPTSFSTTFVAPAIGTYKYKVYASDVVGNANDSLAWQEFTVIKPTATAQNTQAPSIALPYSTIKVTSQLNATDAVKGIYAYLNAPSGFTFLTGYAQNQELGNFTTGQTQNVTWFLSVPITEATYTLNITYTDGYSNQWNSSSVQIQVTSAIGGGYTLDIAGYPEVETGGTYYVESKFKQDETYTAPDSVTIKIYDALGSLIVGPVAMTQESTGQHNYTYTVGASVAEGQWETIINATKSSASYFANHFWKVIGGPFDVRNITVLNSSVSNLVINVTTENTGGANKDLTLEWNLTKESDGSLLDSGADTFMVTAGSTRLWTVNPTTTFIGQVRITMLGYYSGTEKAGAYKVFSTTSAGEYCGDGTCNNGETCSTCPADCGSCTTPSTGGGGGGGGVTPKVEKAGLIFQNFPEIIELATGIEKIVTFTVENIGTIDLTNLILTFENLSSDYYTITPLTINTLKVGETKQFFVKFFITDFSGEKETIAKITSSQIDITQPITINVLNMRDYLISEFEKLKEKINQLKQKLTGEDKLTLVEELKTCEQILSNLKNNIEKEEFINANNNVKETEDCIKDIEDKSSKLKKIPFTEIQMAGYIVWIITWSLILILIAILIIIIWLLYKKFNLLNFIKKKESETTTKTKPTREKEFIDDKLKRIKENLG
ncbi:MAG: DNRLRE domain-containing protein [archaeon]